MTKKCPLADKTFLLSCHLNGRQPPSPSSEAGNKSTESVASGKRKATEEPSDDWGDWPDYPPPIRQTCPWSPVGVEDILLDDMVQVSSVYPICDAVGTFISRDAH